MRTSENARKLRWAYVMAVVLCTALAALGTADGASANEVSDHALGGISRYCVACWRNARLPLDRWSDCTQEVFTRLLQRIPLKGWERLLAGEGGDRRALLRVIETVKKRHQRERARMVGVGEPVADQKDTRARLDREKREV